MTHDRLLADDRIEYKAGLSANEHLKKNDIC